MNDEPASSAAPSDASLTLQEAADALGVHYMTAYRYVRLGLMDAAKHGGTWRVEQSAVDAFRAGSSRATVKPGERAPWASRLEARLIAGDSRGAWGVVESAMAAGAELDEIYLDVLTPAMVQIGERWSAGELDIAVEHRASGMVSRIIGQIGPRFVRRGRPRGMVVTATPVGEYHALPVAMISDLLRLEGWDVSDLGVNLPSESLVMLLRDSPDVVALGLSATSGENLPAFAESCRAVRNAVPELLIVAGGHAIGDRDHARSLGAHEWATSGAQMSALIQAYLDGD